MPVEPDGRLLSRIIARNLELQEQIRALKAENSRLRKSVRAQPGQARKRAKRR